MEPRVELLLKAYTLLVQSRFDGLKGQQLPEAGATILGFQQLCQAFTEGTVALVDVEDGGDDAVT